MGFTKNCACCCRDVCKIKDDTFPQDMFNGLDPRYEFSTSPSLWDLGPVTGLEATPSLRLTPGETGSCFLRIPTGSLNGRRMKITCAIKPYGDVVQNYGIFVSNAFSAMINSAGNSADASEFVIKSGVDEYGAGGTVEYNRNSAFHNNGYLTIQIDYDGITPNVYSAAVSWSYDFSVGHRYLKTITFPVLDSEVLIGFRGEGGGAWDQACIVYNHNADHCFPCLGCVQTPPDKFPVKWLLSVPALDQSNSNCGFCEQLEGDFELVYNRRFTITSGLDIGCAWASTQDCQPCNNLPLLENNTGACWVLSARGLEATGGVDALHYDLYGPGPFDCSGPNTFYFNCSVCQSVFEPYHWTCEQAVSTQFLTITPVFGTL